MKTKDLLKEGITKEVLTSIDIKKEFSPAQLRKDEEPVKLLKCSTGFWVSLGDGKYLTDEKSQLVVISEKEALIGRARYILNFQEEILEQKIQREINRLKKGVDENLKVLIPKLKDILTYAGYLEPCSLTQALVYPMEKEQGFYEGKVEAAKKLADEEMLDLYFKLITEEKDYNQLYILLFQNGLPQIASFQLNDPALLSFFHKDKIDETLDEIQGHDHLYNVAKFNVLKS